MLPFTKVKNALKDDCLVDYIEQFLLEDVEQVHVDTDGLDRLRENMLRQLPSGTAERCLIDEKNLISVHVYMIAGKYVPMDIRNEYALYLEKLYPFVLSFTSIKCRADGFTLTSKSNTLKAKLRFACFSLSLSIGFVIDKNCKWGVVDFQTSDACITAKAIAAAKWAHEFEINGHSMCINPPDRVELFANMNEMEYKNEQIGVIKKQLAKDNKELTLIWGVSLKHRNIAVSKGIKNWDHPRLTAEVFGFSKGITFDTVKHIIEVNNGPDPIVDFSVVAKMCDEGDMFVDIETFNLDNVSDYIFMIGVGYGEDQFKCFTVHNTSIEEEYRIVSEFVQFLGEMDAKRILHWGNHEVNVFKKNELRHKIVILKNFVWVDMCAFFKKKLWVPKGAFNFSLKEFVPAMYKQNMINITWNSECKNGLSAMQEAIIALATNDKDKMDDIQEYNRVDVITTMQIWRYVKSINMLM
jgi:hypothetical protein